MLTAHYELRRNEANRLHFTLFSPTGAVLLTSPEFTDFAQLREALEATQQNCVYPGNFHLRTCPEGRFYFDLNSLSDEFLATSRRFIDDTSRDMCMLGVMSFGQTRIIKDNSSVVFAETRRVQRQR